MQRFGKLIPLYLLPFLFIASWVAIWVIPWQSRMQIAYPWLSTLIALLVLILPGAALYALVSGQIQPSTHHLTFGFVFSHLILAVLGSIGRLVNLPFVIIQQSMLLLGLGLGSIWFSRISIREILVALKNQKWLDYIPTFLILLLAALMTIQRVINDDDLAYLARTISWQSMPAMNFKDVYFGADKLDAVRFWVMSTPYSQAFLSEISGLPTLVLLAGYYDPFLAILSVLGTYQLARALKLSPTLSNTAIASQLAFLALLWPYQHPGYNFFSQISSDKSTAAFVFFPVFLQAILAGLNNTRRSMVLAGLAAFSLSMLHPVMLVFSIFVAGCMIVFGYQQHNLQKRIIILLILAFSMFPHMILRFLPNEAQAAIPFDTQSLSQSRGIESIVLIWEDSGLYGLNPVTLAASVPFEEKIPLHPAVLDWGWMLFPVLAAGLALTRFRQDELAQLILGAFLLGALVLIPVTGWLVGAVVSAWMLERAPWVYPFGLSIAFLLSFFPTRKYLHWVSWGISVTVILLTMYTLQLPNFSRMERIVQRTREMAQVGYFFDEQMANPGIIIGSDKLNDFIPTLSWKAKVISYRPNDPSYPYFYPEAERIQRYEDRLAIFSNQHSPEDRLKILQKYNARYILLESGDAKPIQKLVDTFPDVFTIHSVGRFLVVEIK